MDYTPAVAIRHVGVHEPAMFGLVPWLDTIVRGAVLAAIALFWVTALVRVIGLRTFSKMTPFDFVVTLASASLLASAGNATEWTGFAQALVAIAMLLFIQFAIARLRQRAPDVRGAIENEPIVLMRDGVFIEGALRRTRVTRTDVMAKLRGANALDLSLVRAVVLETTGDISVLHGDAIDPRILDGVKRADPT